MLPFLYFPGFDCFKSSLPSDISHKSKHNDRNVERKHDCHEYHHRVTHVELVLEFQIEVSEAHEVIDLHNAEEVIHSIHHIVPKYYESSRAIKIY